MKNTLFIQILFFFLNSIDQKHARMGQKGKTCIKKKLKKNNHILH